MASIHTNLTAISAMQTLRSVDAAIYGIQDQISSGLRIKTPADDAAYWSIGTTMRSDQGAISAVVDALGLSAATLDTTHAGITAVIDLLDSFQSRLIAARQEGVDKGKIQKELAQYQQQVLSIAKSASFSGQNLLNTDVADIFDENLNRKSLVSSFARSGNGQVSIDRMDFSLLDISLFNSTGGGLLQADPRDPLNLGGIRYDTRSEQRFGLPIYSTGNMGGGTGSGLGFTFEPVVFDDPGDAISFQLVVDSDDPSSGVTPVNIGKVTDITIDRALVDSVLPFNNGVISTASDFYTVFSHAVNNANAGVSPGFDGYKSYQITSDENSGLDGSSVELRNLVTTGGMGTGGLEEKTAFGTRGSYVDLWFQPFKLYSDVEVSMKFFINQEAPVTILLNKDVVNAALGKNDGTVDTIAEMTTLLSDILPASDLLYGEGVLPHALRIRTDPLVDRLQGFRTGIGFFDINVNIEPLNRIDFLAIDVAENPDSIDDYIRYMDAISQKVIGAAATLGSLQTRVDMQADFATELSGIMDQGIGRLVDADMNDISARFKAEQARQQLAIQSLQIANSTPESILQLFQAA